MTATVETVSEQLDLASILPSEKMIPAIAKAITLSEADVGTATANVSKAKVAQDGQEGNGESDGGLGHLRQSGQPGEFQLKIEDLPQYLQYLYQLLNELPKCENPDILYYQLQVINVLCLNGDAFTKASREQRDFFVWAQENVLIKSLWNLCNAEHSHICQVTVPILLHCVTLPSGYDVFWKVIQESFHSTDWRVRFVAVERVTIIARFMDSTPLRTVVPLQAALANAFCYLISSIDDINVFVAQRATLNLGTIHDAAIKSLVFCLEMQFDTVIVDRPMVLQSLYQLHNSLCDRKILTWDFFLNRFDTLFVEAQIHLEKSGDIAGLRDLRNNDLNSEVFIRKIHRAHEALSQSQNGSATSSVKTLSASFGTKWPYKRTMSAPASMVPRVDAKGPEKEKVYSRQYSAPILKRKSSRLGLDGHVHSFNTIDDANLLGYVHKIVDLEEGDKETMHLLVFLLMQFLSRADQAYPTETDKHMAKTQNIVLKHLYLLLGYSQADKGLYIPGPRIRTSPVFSAYLSNLPQLLDQNHVMGLSLLNTSLVLLQYSPCPFAYGNGTNLNDQYPYHVQHILNREDRFGAVPGGSYGLWCLEPHLRHSWLMSLVVLLYKYQYNQPPYCHSIQSLVRIVLNTLDSRHHRCKRTLTPYCGPPAIVSQTTTTVSVSSTAVAAAAAATAIAPTARVSQHSTMYIASTPPLPLPSQPPMQRSTDQSDCELLPTITGTPPSSKLFSTEQSSLGRRRRKSKRNDGDDGRCIRALALTVARPTEEEDDDDYDDSSMRQKRKGKINDNAQETDETESELIAIPESDLSDSTLYGSNHDSFDDNATNVVDTSMAGLCLRSAPCGKNATNVNLELKVNGCKASLEKRPTWFIGSEEESLQANKYNQVAVSQEKPSSFRGIASVSASSCTDSQHSDTTSESGGLKNSCVKSSCQTSRKYKSAIGSSICQSVSYSSDSSNGAGGGRNGSGGGESSDSRSGSRSASSSSTQQCENKSERDDHSLLLTPSVERLLPIGSQRTPSSKSPKSNAENRQQAKNDLSDSLNDYNLSDNNSATHSPTFCRGSQLNIPSQERLLPVGVSHTREINVIVEKVKHALGMTCQHEAGTNKDADTIEMKPSKSCTKYYPKEKFKENHFGRNDSDFIVQRPLSPRRLTKQVALESPPPYRENDRSSMRGAVLHHKDVHCQNKVLEDRLGCNVGAWTASVSGGLASPSAVTGIDAHPTTVSTNVGHVVGWSGGSGEDDPRHTSYYSGGGADMRQSSFRTGSECVTDRCSECGATIEQYTDEEIGLCIIALGTFVHREPALAAPMLPDILSVVAAITDNARYPWQNEQNVHLPGGAVSVAHQFIRCVLHQLAPNGVFVQMFQTRAPPTARSMFFRSVAHALVDFNELNPVAPLQLLIETLNSKKILAIDTLPTIVENMACYLDCLPLESGLGTVMPLWNTLLSQLEILFRRMVFFLNNFDDLVPLLRIMISILKIPCINQFKGMLDPFSKILSHAIQNQPLEYYYVNELCHLCNRAFNRERDKMFLCRMVIYELLQALKFKSSLPDCNFLMLINLVLQDCGGSFLPSSVVLHVTLSGIGGSDTSHPSSSHAHAAGIHVTNAADCMRLHIGDVIEFLADFHTISKIKSYRRGPASLSVGTASSGTMTACGSAQGVLSSTAGSSTGGPSAPLQPSLPPSASSVVVGGSSATSGTSSSVGSSQQSAQTSLVVGLNDDTLGGMIKAGLAQYLALDLTKSNGRDNRAVSKYFPWLCNTTSTQPAGPREFVDCIGHVRLLSWLLLGSLTHTAIHHSGPQGVTAAAGDCGGAVGHCCGGGGGCVGSQPIPQESSCQVADHIQLILAGFAEQPKASVLHMSSLFHVFILCQLWTIYLEQGQLQTAAAAAAAIATATAAQQQQHAAESFVTMNVLFDFWGKITPCILQLISQSKTLSEMVSLHFLCMLEALLECRSTFLSKLLPLWTPVLYSNHVQLPSHLQVRLQNCRNYPAATVSFGGSNNSSTKRRSGVDNTDNRRRTKDGRTSSKSSGGDLLPHPIGNPTLLRWLQRLQFKMGQIELQSSTAVQFYSL